MPRPPTRRRAAALAVAVGALGVLGGCYSVVYPNQPNMVDGPVLRTLPAPTSTVLSNAQLCLYATDGVQTMVGEILTAPDDKYLQQTIDSYGKYAALMREIAGRADTEDQRRKIEAVASAAQRHADDVRDRGLKANLDDPATKAASTAAFPGCSFKREGG